jgi:serine/threonine-protein kinase
MQIGRYELVGKVASGSAQVWKAADPASGRTVAIKQIGGLTSGEARERVRAEVSTLAGLADPNVVALVDVLDDGQRVCLVTEWIDGATLGAVVASGVRLDERQAVAAMRGALSGLAHAHQRGIVHGDVSLSNVMLSTSGESKVIDFGLAGVAAAHPARGAAAYRSPEVAAGTLPTPTDDVYAAAAVLAHLLSGTARRPPLTDGVAQPVKAVLDRALAPPTARYRDAGEFLAALDDAAGRRYGAGWLTQAGLAGVTAGLAASPLLAVEGAEVVGSGQSGGLIAIARRRPRLTLGLALGGAAVIVAGAIAIASNSHKSKSPSAAAGSPSPTVPNNSSSAGFPSTTSSSPSPASQFSGTYRVVSRVTVADYSADWSGAKEKVGNTYVTYWKVTTTCKANGSCSATRTSSSGTKDTYSLRGTSWVHSGAGINNCVDTKTGKTVSSKYRYAWSSRLNPNGTGLIGQYQLRYTPIAPCKGSLHEVVQWTVNPISPSRVPSTAFPSPKNSASLPPSTAPGSPTPTATHS